MTTEALIHKAIDVNLANLMLGHEVFEADGATFVRNTAFPRVHDANFVTHVTASTPAEIDRLMSRLDETYAHCKHRCFRVDNRVAPAFEARLALIGYTQTSALCSLLEGGLDGTPKDVDVRPVVDDAGWDAVFALNRDDWAEHAARIDLRADDLDGVGVALAQSQVAKSPPVRYWLAYDGGEARGYFNAWEGFDGVGQVENLFVQQEYRHRGLATALIHRCVADAREHGAGPVVIVSDPTDTPKHMYAALGFRPVATQRSWLRQL